MSKAVKKASEKPSDEELWEKRVEAELSIITAIRNGDIEKLRSFEFRPEGIDTRLLRKVDVVVFPSKSKEVHIEKINGPTVVVYSILCEQPEILTFFLTKFSPDLSDASTGWTPLHFACTTRDVSCLKILLQHSFIQENINMAVGSKVGVTTALHLAVRYQLHETVLLLTSAFPTITYPSKSFWKLENKIDVSLVSGWGETPLHTAVRQRDWDMIQILINAGANMSAVDKDGLSAYDVAKSLGFKRLVDLFEECEIETRGVLEKRYLDAMENERAKSEFFRRVHEKVEFVHENIKKIDAKL